MKTSVTPWSDDLVLTDAFRAPLAESFKLLEVIHNYEYQNSSLSLDNLCLNVEAIKRSSKKMTQVLPEYNCLILSPSNLWNQDFNLFQADTNLINTIYNYQNVAKGKISISQMLFGLPLKDSGIKRYPLRSKQRVVRFAVTIFMTRYEQQYIKGLHNYLKFLYPMTEHVSNVSENTNANLFIYYPEDVNHSELIPLSITYALLFFYVYYLMRKMEHVRSKFGMAFSAVFMVLASLSMTIGVCFFFGLEITGRGRGKQVFPYLVIVVGLENVFVLTKSVVSTLAHLDAKIRVAQGLSKEGWNITKNLLIEVTILTAGLLTFVPAIQEFCIFAIVGVLSDFFLQMTFFSTVLSIYIRSSEHSTYPQYSYSSLSTHFATRYSYSGNSSANQYNMEEYRRISSLSRSRSHPRLSGKNIIASETNHDKSTQIRIPKRVKVVHFWARTRIVQRCFMIGMIGWITAIAYNAETIQYFIGPRKETEHRDSNIHSQKKSNVSVSWDHSSRGTMLELQAQLLKAEEEYKKKNFKQKITKSSQNDTIDEYSWLRKIDYDARFRVSFHHWSSILAFYNFSLSGSYITILPSLYLAYLISPDKARLLRNPNEKGVQFRWHSLAVALDPFDFTGDLESTVQSSFMTGDDELVQPLVPTSPMELMMSAMLCIISVIVIAYSVFVIYKCICTRNYAEWRTSWSLNSSEDPTDYMMQVVLEAAPVTIPAHDLQVEFIVTDGNTIVSTCLGHEVKVWDLETAKIITVFDRLKARLYLEHYENDLRCVNSNRYNLAYPLVSAANTNANDIMHTIENEHLNTSVIRRGHRRQVIDFLDHQTRNKVSINSAIRDNQQILSSELYTYDVVKYNRMHTIDRRDTSQSVNSSPEKLEDKGILRMTVPIWCIDCKDNLTVLGCKDGSLEFWECTTGNLKCVYREERASFMAIKIIGRTVVAGTLNGEIIFYRLEIFSSRQQSPPYNAYTAHKRGHARSGSMGSIVDHSCEDMEIVHCVKIECTQAHSKAISVLEVDGGKVISGSYDHMLKIYNLDDRRLLYNLLGHRGPITTLFIDRINPTVSASGSQDGLLCMWDLHTGTCLYSIQAHDGAICALTYSASYIISLGLDEKICIWDRFRGHLLNTISMAQAYCTSMTMITHNLLITSKEGSLMVIDVATGEPVRLVKLGHFDKGIFIRQIVNLGEGVVCDFGRQLSLVKFPLVFNKND